MHSGMKRVILFLFVFLALTLVGCGGTSSASQQNDAQDPASSQEEAQEAGQSVQSEPVSFVGTWDMLGSDAIEDYINFEEGGRVREYIETSSGAAVMQGSWKQTGDDELAITVANSELTGVYSGGKLTITMASTKQKSEYTKTDDKAIPAEIQVYGEYSIPYDEPITLLDNDEALVRVVAKGENVSSVGSDFGYELVCENRTDRNLLPSFSWNCTVNGENVVANNEGEHWGGIAPGKTETVKSFFLKDGLSFDTLDGLKNVDGTLQIWYYEEGATSSSEHTDYPLHID